MAALDFQPLDFQPDAGNEPPEKRKPVTGQLDFQPLDFQPEAGTAPGTALQQEEKDRSFFHRPVATSEPVTDAEIQEIAERHGVDKDTLKQIAPFFSAAVEPKNLGQAAEAGVAGAAGFLGEAAMGLPQFLAKKAASPAYEDAIDELRSVAKGRQGYLPMATEMVAMPGAAAARTASAGKGFIRGTAEATAVGAAGGVAQSKKGEETESGLFGAALGGAVGGLVSTLERKGITSAEKELLESTPAIRRIDVEAVTAKEMAARQKSEDLMEDIYLRGKETITPEEARTIVREQMGDEGLEKYLDPSSPEGSLVRENLPPDIAQSDDRITAELANDIVEKRVKDFTADVTGERPADFEEALTALDKMKRQGPEYVQDQYRRFAESEAFQTAVDREGLRVGAGATGTAGSIANKLSASQFTLRLMDDKYGTDAEKILSELNQGRNRMSYSRAAFRSDLDGIHKAAVQAGVDSDIRNTNSIVRALEGEAPPSSDAAPVVQKIQDYFAKVRSFANSTVKEIDPKVRTLAIPELENYVTHIAVPVPEMVASVEQRLKGAAEQASQMFGRSITDIGQLSQPEYREFLQTPAMKELVEFANWKSAQKATPRTASQLSATIQEAIYSRPGRINLDKVARATLERTGEIPEFIREQNLYKIMDRYTYDVLTNLYQRTPLDKMKLVADKLDRIGADVDASYVRDIVTDTLGIRKGTAAEAYRNILVESSRSLDGLIEKYKADPIRRTALQTLKGVPLLPQFLSRQLYPNVLGWFRIRPIIQNLLSGLSRTAPELGGAYGMTTYMRGLVYGVANRASLIEKTKAMGYVPEEFIRQGERALADGIRASGIVAAPLEKLEGMAKMGMSVYQASETLNRISILGTAHMMAHDLAAGSRVAFSSLQRFPASLRKEIIPNLNNPAMVEKTLSRYLNDVTAFQYTRPAMFQYGRSLGPLFSTFSTWPTSILGEALYEVRSKGLLKGGGKATERLVPIFLAFLGVDYVLSNSMNLAESDRYKKLVGSKGLAGATPIDTLRSFTSGEIFTPPMVDAVMKSTIIPVSKGDVSGIERGADSMAFNFIPMAGALRFLTDDMVTYITGERPEGSTQTERTLSGINRMTGGR